MTNKSIALLVTASLALGLVGSAGAASKSRHHRHAHHKTMMSHRTMSHTMSHRRTGGMTHMMTGAGRTSGGPMGSGGTSGGRMSGSTMGTGGHRRHGRGVNGGVFSEPTITNNGQASPGTPPSGVNGTGTDKAGGGR